MKLRGKGGREQERNWRAMGRGGFDKNILYPLLNSQAIRKERKVKWGVLCIRVERKKLGLSQELAGSACLRVQAGKDLTCLKV